MRTVEYFRHQAEQCRMVARHLSLREDREKLLRMSVEWETLAQEREEQLRREAAAQAKRA